MEILLPIFRSTYDLPTVMLEATLPLLPMAGDGVLG
jgi:hypothetical protein